MKPVPRLSGITRLKTELLCAGVRVDSGASKGRVVGAGPSGGRYILLPRTLTPPTNVPTWGKFISTSPFQISKIKSGSPYAEYLLHHKDDKIKVKIVENVSFLKKSTGDGTPMWKIASLHGVDVVATTLNKYCSYWKNELECKFCAIQHNIKMHNRKSLAVKNVEHIVDVVVEAEKEGFCKHVTLTSGSTNTPDRGLSQYIPYLKELKEKTSVPIHVQTEPPNNTGELSKLYDAGADTIGIHIETFDENVRREICPGKSMVSMKKYFEAWSQALKIFGENQVDTFILCGLGEREKETLSNIEKLCSEGIIPYIVPVRHLPETQTENMSPPDPSSILRILVSTVSHIKDYGLKLERNKAGCIRCGACSPIREAIEYGCE